MIELNKY